MAVPVFAPPTDSPVKIDAGVAYDITVAAQGADTIAWQPAPNFSISRYTYSGSPAAHSFSVQYTGPIPQVPTVYAITFIATNSTGTVTQVWNFEVQPASLSIIELPHQGSNGVACGIRLLGSSTAGSANLPGPLYIYDPFTSAPPIATYNPDQILAVGDIVFCGPPRTSIASDPAFDNRVLYVVAVTSTYFQLSATPGGSAIKATITASLIRYFYPGFAKSGSDTFWIGSTSGLAVDQLISFQYYAAQPTAGQPATFVPTVPIQLASPLYVKTIVDSAHVKLALTKGGSAITASADYPPVTSNPENYGSSTTPASNPLSLIVSVENQRYPVLNLNSATDESDFSNGAATGTFIIAAATAVNALDAFIAYNVPPGLTFTDRIGSTGDCILAGTLAAGANDTYYPVLVVGIKGSYQTKKYYIVKVGTGATFGSPSGPSVPVINTAVTTITATQGVAFTFQPAATNNPSAWSATPLPAGLAFDSVTGALSGAFQNSGSFNITFIASNAGGSSTPVVFTFNVAAGTAGTPGGGPGSTPPPAPVATVIGDPTIYDPSAVARARNVALVLLVDEDQKTLVGNIQAQTPKSLFPFFEGDQFPVDLYFLYPTGNVFSPYSLKAFSADPGIRFGIGKIQFPTGGTFTVTFGANTTSALAYNITAAALQTALEGLGSIGSGNISVTGDYQSGFALEFKGSLGLSNVAQVTVNAASLTPFSAALVRTARGGTGSVNEVQEIRLGQLIAAYQASWSPIYAAGTITPSTVQGGGSGVHEIQKILFSKRPIGGTFTVTLDSLTTDPISVFAAQVDIQAAIDLTLGAGIATVSLTPGPVPYLIVSWADAADHTQLTVDETDVIWNYGYTATVSVDTVGVDQLVGPLGSITDALLEIEVTPSGGTPETMIQQTATIKSDLLKTGLLGSP